MEAALWYRGMCDVLAHMPHCMAVSLSKCETACAQMCGSIRLHATVCDYVCERDRGGHCLELCVV